VFIFILSVKNLQVIIYIKKKAVQVNSCNKGFALGAEKKEKNQSCLGMYLKIMG
jgi:hypothetical protein